MSDEKSSSSTAQRPLELAKPYQEAPTWRLTPSLAMMALIWVRTVSTATPRWAAMNSVDCPSAR